MSAVAITATFLHQQINKVFKSVRHLYTLTVADFNNGFVSVPITWPSPFADTNYTLSWSVQDPTNTLVGDAYFVEDVVEVTPLGFLAIIDLGGTPQLEVC